MAKYRCVRMNEVRYTDSENVLDKWLDEGFELSPAFEADTVEPTKQSVEDDAESEKTADEVAAVVDEPADEVAEVEKPKKTTKNGKK